MVESKVTLKSLLRGPGIALHQVDDHGVHQLGEDGDCHLRLEADVGAGEDPADAFLAQRYSLQAVLVTLIKS